MQLKEKTRVLCVNPDFLTFLFQKYMYVDYQQQVNRVQYNIVIKWLFIPP
jgi:hypothetical protein